MTINWSIGIAAGGGASLEFLETAAIAYAIARSGYVREAIWGSVAGLTSVAVVAGIFGTGLQLIPLQWLQIGIGAILLWFGWGWVKKAVVRQVEGKRAGWLGDDPLDAEGIALHSQSQGFNVLNFVVMTKSAALEALEVAVIVITLGLASQAWAEALIATLLALVASIVLVLLLHPHLLKLPDVLIKLGTGILLCGLGTFWLGEGLGLEWWFGDLAIVAIVALYSLFATLAIYSLRQKATDHQQVDLSA
ncbi:COG4280 domain-containing protein [Egbenema bharatensis]|uniref:COG4280 domain-containing protein n=1 Tax=Egbenema bharatensis TaxID=3463334 RepID=UPI003A837B17